MGASNGGGIHDADDICHRNGAHVPIYTGCSFARVDDERVLYDNPNDDTTPHNNDCLNVQINHSYHVVVLLENVHLRSARTRPRKLAPLCVRSYREFGSIAIMVADPDIKLGDIVTCAYVAPTELRGNPL